MKAKTFRLHSAARYDIHLIAGRARTRPARCSDPSAALAYVRSARYRARVAASLRQLGACIGLNGSFSVLGQFFGFSRGKLPPNPDPKVKNQVSLVRQARLLKSRHFGLNIVQVGSDNFTDADRQLIDFAILRIRDIYAPVNLGIGRVQHWGVRVADAQGLDVLTDEDELDDLAHGVAITNGSIDVCIPHVWAVSNLAGRSPTPGPCNDKDEKGSNASAVGLFDLPQTSRSFAHEVGHYLGLDHRNGDPNNLMCQSNKAADLMKSVNLDGGQYATMNSHCLVGDACS